MSSPVAFIIFNRPDTTKQVFAAIREAKPSRLYIIADGPRNEEERRVTEETRAVTEGIDWPCTVARMYSEINMGCRNRVISGLNEVFEQEESAIILEDDCLPHPDFFEYCNTLLHFYRDNDEVGTINGTGVAGLAAASGGSPCVFTRFSIVWGWATWRRVWQQTAAGMEGWEQRKKSGWVQKLYPSDPHIAWGLRVMFNQMLTGYNAWSYILVYSLMRNNLVNVHPVENLISNIGFDERATHTHTVKAYSNLPLSLVGWVQYYPEKVVYSALADKIIYEMIYYWHTRKPTAREYIYRSTRKGLYKLKQKLLPGISLKKLFKLG